MLLRQIAYMTSAGNHEIERDSSGATFQAWTQRLPNPWQQSGSASPQYYSLDYGSAPHPSAVCSSLTGMMPMLRHKDADRAPCPQACTTS